MRRDIYATPTPRAPKGGVLLLGLLLGLVLLACMAVPFGFFIARQREFDSRLESLDLALSIGWRIFPFAVAVVLLRIIWRRFGWSSTISAEHQIEYARAIAPALASRPHVSAPAQIIDQAPEPAALPAPTLPDVALLGDILPTLPRGKLCYGVLPGGEPLMMTFGQSYHILVSGDTRSGKSNAIDSLLVQLHHQVAHGYKLRILCGDFKRELRATWQRSPLVETVETDPKAIAEILDELTRGPDGILDRYSRFERYGEQHGRVVRNIADYVRASGEHLPLTVMALDELNALLTVADKDTRLSEALSVVLQLGAGAGVYIASGAQYLSAKVFAREGSKQFVSRAMFGVPDPILARVMFGAGKFAPETVDLLTGQPGRGLIRTAGHAQPIPFQALRCDEDDILSAVRLITDRQPTMPRVAETVKPDVSASETTETSFTISPEIADIVRRLAREKKPKKETIALIWGAKPGGSDAYKQASAAYDDIVRGEA